MCDGRPFAPLFRRLAGRGALFRGFPFRWVPHVVISLTHCLTVHVATSCPMEDPLYECGPPCDTMSSLFFTGPYSLSGRLLYHQNVNNPALPLPMKIPMTILLKTLFQLSRTLVGGVMLFNHLRYSKILQVGIHVATSLMAVCDVLLGTLGVSLSVLSSQRNRELKLNYFEKLLENNNVICLQEVHGKDEFLQAIQVWAPRFKLFGTFIPGNENAGGSAICIHEDLLPEDASVTHVITCQGRDHIVNVQSGRTNLVIVNFHFEPELTLRRLHERLRLITPHWPSYPNAVGIILGDFNISEPEEGRFNVWSQTFTDGDTGRTALFHSLFLHVLEIAQPDHTWRDSTALGIIRTLSSIDRIFFCLLMAEARDFHCSSHVSENVGNRSIPSDHAAVRIVIQKPSNQGQQCKRIPSCMSKHPVFCSILKRLHDGHRYAADPFGALGDFKSIIEKAKKADCSRAITQDA